LVRRIFFTKTVPTLVENALMADELKVGARLRDRSARYTRTAMALHWAIAALIAWQLGSGLWMVPAIDDAARWVNAFWVYQVHKSTGLMVLVLSLFRLIWRWTHLPPPLPSHMPAWQRAASGIMHGTLYVLMIAVPLAGWLVASSSALGLPTEVFGWFAWPHLPVSPAFEPIAKAAHRLLAYALALLAAGHVAAALAHQFAAHDGLLWRIWPQR
jgi:cytochrome b561